MTNERTHIDLFTGLAGFSLAAKANGVRTIAMCEADPRCQEFLAKAWPGVPVWPDVRTFSLANAQCSERWPEAERWDDGNRYDGGREEATSRHPIYPPPVWLLTAGVPCQPASRAGKQRGRDDDRWLWDAALKVFAGVRPTWAIFENPPGVEDLFEYGVQLGVDSEGNSTEPVGTMVNRDGCGVFCETLDAIEAEGYAVKTLGIPACALGAPHRRMRYWIVCRRLAYPAQAERARLSTQRFDVYSEATGMAHPPESGHKRTMPARGCEWGPTGRPRTDTACGNESSMVNPGHHSDGPEQRHESWEESRWAQTSADSTGFGPTGNWSNYVWLPCADGKIRRAPDDSFSLVDGLHRSVLGALGNSIVWQVAQTIIAAMIQSNPEA